jgi:serine/threonine protein kinase
MCENILNGEPTFEGKVTPSLKNLIKGLLSKNPEERLSFVESIKSHEFFSSV